MRAHLETISMSSEGSDRDLHRPLQDHWKRTSRHLPMQQIANKSGSTYSVHRALDRSLGLNDWLPYIRPEFLDLVTGKRETTL
jgi:hypothetical protein